MSLSSQTTLEAISVYTELSKLIMEVGSEASIEWSKAEMVSISEVFDCFKILLFLFYCFLYFYTNLAVPELKISS